MDPRQSIDDILDEPMTCVSEYLHFRKAFIILPFLKKKKLLWRFVEGTTRSADLVFGPSHWRHRLLSRLNKKTPQRGASRVLT